MKVYLIKKEKWATNRTYRKTHCLKSVRIRSRSGPHFPAFSRIRTECGEIRGSRLVSICAVMFAGQGVLNLLIRV